MISDLSPGDRLSLKGKLFELQKKLNIIDIEHRLDEQYSFQPKILEYDLPNRQKSFLENSTKADIIRKQKKKMLQDSLALQSEESCTFAPHIYTSNKYNQSLDHRPAHVRLNERAKVYSDSIERKRMFYQQFDDNGTRLFQPSVKHTASFKHSSFMDSTRFDSTSGSALQNNLGVDEYLYQDAKDREFRLQNLVSTYDEDLRKSINSSKVNPNSSKMVKRKMEKYALEIATLIDANGKGHIEYGSLVESLEALGVFEGYDTEAQLRNNQIFWNVINFRKGNVVLKSDVAVVITASLMSKSTHSVASMIHQYLNDTQQTSDSPLHSSIVFKEKELVVFREIIEKLIDEINKSKDDSSGRVGRSQNQNNNDETFRPKIHKISYKLAERKQKRDLALLSSVISEELASQQETTSKQNVELQDETNQEEWDKTNGHNPSIKSFKEDYSVSTISSHPNSHHDLLLARGILQQKKREELAKSLLKQEMVDCTFKPVRVTTKYDKGSLNDRSSKVLQNQELNSGEVLRNFQNGVGPGLSIDQLSIPTSASSSPPPPPPPPLTTASPINLDVTISTSDPATATTIPAHERLYALKDRKPKILSEILPVEIQQLQHCTFAPKVHPAPVLTKNKNIPIPSFDKSVERMRSSFFTKEKEKYEQSDEIQKKLLEEKYEKSRLLSKQGAVPFTFESDKRVENKHLKEKHEQKLKPELIVEVKLSASKTARIPVRNGDNPVNLAKKFAKIYSLDGQAVDVLTTVLKQSMDSNGIAYTVEEISIPVLPNQKSGVVAKTTFPADVDANDEDKSPNSMSKYKKEPTYPAWPRKHRISISESALMDFGGARYDDDEEEQLSHDFEDDVSQLNDDEENSLHEDSSGNYDVDEENAHYEYDEANLNDHEDYSSLHSHEELALFDEGEEYEGERLDDVDDDGEYDSESHSELSGGSQSEVEDIGGTSENPSPSDEMAGKRLGRRKSISAETTPKEDLESFRISSRDESYRKYGITNSREKHSVLSNLL